MIKPNTRIIKDMSKFSKSGSKRKNETPVPVETKKINVPVFTLNPEIRQLRGSGMVLVCGQGECGQLGLGDEYMEKARPTLVPELFNIVDICAGGMHTLCLNSDGKVISWGCNDECALGRDTSVDGADLVPGHVLIPEKVLQISAGDSHSAALTESGKVYAWGSFRDSHGAMGLTLKGNEQYPVLIVDNIAKISSGVNHLLLLTCDGKLYSIGCAEQGQLGRIPERSADRNSRLGIGRLLKPGLVTHHLRIKHEFDDIWTGDFCSFVREHTTGHIYAFGLNNYYQLGLEDVQCYSKPVRVPSFSSKKKWVEISGGLHHTLALDDTGVTYVMGNKEYGRLGLGESCNDVKKPTVIPILQNKKIVNVACGSYVSFAVTDNGDAYAWGTSSPQLGCGDVQTDIYEPKLIAGGQLKSKSVIKISSGGQHTVFLVKERLVN